MRNYKIIFCGNLCLIIKNISGLVAAGDPVACGHHRRRGHCARLQGPLADLNMCERSFSLKRKQEQTVLKDRGLAK